MRYFALHLILLTALPVTAQRGSSQTQNPLTELIDRQKADFGPWAADPDQFEVQVLYTQIDRREDGTVSLTTHRWGADSTNYFYPASTVKMPAAILALQRLNQLGVEGLDPQTLLFHGTGTAPASAPQTTVSRDTSSRSGYPSVGHYIRKLFLTSDNDAYNRLFEWLGPTYINESLAEVGIVGTRQVHRVGVGGFDTETHAWLNPVKFISGPDVPYQIGERHDTFYRALPRVQRQVKGAGYTNNDGELIKEPFDFTHKNYLSVRHLHDIVARATVPEAFPPNRRFDLTETDYALLRRAMSERPRESDYPRYDKPDNYVKFWLYGDRPDETAIPANVRILNKVGWAYGYLTDAAYITDTDTGLEFILVGTIHTNANRIYNDGEYEYDGVGLPFFGELGRAVMRYERERRE